MTLAQALTLPLAATIALAGLIDRPAVVEALTWTSVVLGAAVVVAVVVAL